MMMYVFSALTLFNKDLFSGSLVMVCQICINNASNKTCTDLFHVECLHSYMTTQHADKCPKCKVMFEYQMVLLVVVNFTGVDCSTTSFCVSCGRPT